MSYNAVPFEIDEHRDALVQIWCDNLSDSLIAKKAPARLRWLYQDNPAGPARTWLGMAPTGAIGCGTFYPRTTWALGRPMRAGVLADFAVNRDHRVAGPAVTIQRAVAQGSAQTGTAFVYGWPNRKSLAVFKRVGYKVVGETTRWVKILRSRKQVSKRIGNEVLARALSVGIDGGLAAFDMARLAPQLWTYRSEVTFRADRRVDELSARVARAFVMGEKTAAYLNWRYADFPTLDYRFFLLSIAERLVGYLVYAVVGDSALVVDLLAEDLDDTLDQLLLRFSRRAWSEGATTVSLTFVGSGAFTRGLRRLLFRPRPTERSLIVYLAPNAEATLSAALGDPEQWFMLDGELDI